MLGGSIKRVLGTQTCEWMSILDVTIQKLGIQATLLAAFSVKQTRMSHETRGCFPWATRIGVSQSSKLHESSEKHNIYVCICICISICICICINKNICICICSFLYMCICMYVYMYICICKYIYVYMYICIYSYMNICLYVYICIYSYMFICR